MRRTTIFIICSVCFLFACWISSSQDAASVAFGQILGAGTALMWQWFVED